MEPQFPVSRTVRSWQLVLGQVAGDVHPRLACLINYYLQSRLFSRSWQALSGNAYLRISCPMPALAPAGMGCSPVCLPLTLLIAVFQRGFVEETHALNKDNQRKGWATLVWDPLPAPSGSRQRGR